MTLDVATYVALGLDRAPPLQVNGGSNADILASLNHPDDAPYHPCPEALPDASIPPGNVTKYADWNGSRIYPGTLRDLFVYTPAQLIVFNDGAGYLSRRGPVRAAQVLDSLHAAGDGALFADSIRWLWPRRGAPS